VGAALYVVFGGPLAGRQINTFYTTGVIMQEISANIFIETSYPGVTLGAISGPHGQILIDAPFRAEDARSWRSALVNLGSGVDRMLINMDAHFDRTLGTRAMDCTVVSHEKVDHIFRNRPVTFKTQGAETGSEWEQYNGLGSIRWAPPEITFSECLDIHWDETPISLVSRPGPAAGAIWAELPEQRLVFLGDAVVKDQPPYLAGADLPAWIQNLQLLLGPRFQNWLLVSGRGGLVADDEVRSQLKFLQDVHQQLEDLAAHSAPPDEAEHLVPALLKQFPAPGPRAGMYRQRLLWGLRHYYQRHFKPGSAEALEE
jgi:glyoxylase-like metal-dependent hydrolase (beta-lactamase superfamily II)